MYTKEAFVSIKGLFDSSGAFVNSQFNYIAVKFL